MINVLLISIVMLGIPEPEQHSTTDIMVPEIARSQIAQAIDTDIEPTKGIEILSRVIERCQDSNLLAVAYFNLGVIQLRESDAAHEQLPEAIESFLSADRLALNPSLRSSARYNLGHCLYLQANLTNDILSTQQMPDLQGMVDSLIKRVDSLRSSAGAFRSVFEVDPNDKQATSNVERIRKEIQMLLDQIDALEEMRKQQQEEQQQRQQQQQDAADKLNDLAEKQQQQSENTKSNPPQSEQDENKQQEDQQELCDQTDEAKSETSKQEDTDEITQKIQEARDAQERAKEHMTQGEQDQAAEEQANAAQALKEAAQAMQSKADQTKEQGENNESDDSDESEAESNSDEASETGDQSQINEVAKNLLDKERREREARQAYRAKGQPVKVEKDW